MRAKTTATKRHAASVSLSLIAAALILALLPASAARADAVGDWLAWVNNVRAGNGVAPLQLDAEQSGLAQARADANAAAGQLAHTPDLTASVTEDWNKLGENVGTGGSVEAIGAKFVGSPKHFANLVDPAFTGIGIGVTMVGGTMWVTHRFIGVSGGGGGSGGGSGGGGGGGGGGAVTPPPTTPATVPPTAPPTTAPKPRPTTPPTTLPVIVTTTTTAPAPPPVTIPAEPQRVAAVLDALHQLDL